MFADCQNADNKRPSFLILFNDVYMIIVSVYKQLHSVFPLVVSITNGVPAFSD